MYCLRLLKKGSNDAERAVMPEFVGIDVEEVKKALNSIHIHRRENSDDSQSPVHNPLHNNHIPRSIQPD